MWPFTRKPQNTCSNKLKVEDSYKEWAVLELMGHHALAGLVSVRRIAGVDFIHVEVPATQHEPAEVQDYSPKAIYCLTPTTEAIARRGHAAGSIYEPQVLRDLRNLREQLDAAARGEPLEEVSF